jgi:hypothetical protein
VVVGVDVREIADVAREKRVDRVRNTRREEGDDPPGEGREQGGHGPQREPEEVRNREQQPEEDSQARAPQVVVVHEPDRVLPRLELLHGRGEATR